MLSPELMSELTMAYTAPGRFFHNLDHIQACLAELEDALQNGASVEDPDAVRFAIWFHDVVYDGTRNDNEERSADAAREAALRLGHPVDFADRVHRLVLVTKHSDAYPTLAPDEELLCDIDLTSLAAPDFAANTEKIRQEYAHVPPDLFYPARRRILSQFLTRNRIYRTRFFSEKYEAKARVNLLREIHPPDATASANS